MCRAKQYGEALKAIETLPASVRGLGRMKLLRIEALLGEGQAAEAERMMKGRIELTDVREGEQSLTHMWFWLCALKKVQAEGGEVTDGLIQQMSESVTPPEYLDFRMR